MHEIAEGIIHLAYRLRIGRTEPCRIFNPYCGVAMARQDLQVAADDFALATADP